MVLNEVGVFSVLGPQRAVLDPRSFTIATFALCGFANLSSIGIQIGGIGALAPNKKGELARLGIRAMLAGTMANLMSASIAGIILLVHTRIASGLLPVGQTWSPISLL